MYPSTPHQISYSHLWVPGSARSQTTIFFASDDEDLKIQGRPAPDPVPHVFQASSRDRRLLGWTVDFIQALSPPAHHERKKRRVSSAHHEVARFLGTAPGIPSDARPIGTAVRAVAADVAEGRNTPGWRRSSAWDPCGARHRYVGAGSAGGPVQSVLSTKEDSIEDDGGQRTTGPEMPYTQDPNSKSVQEKSRYMHPISS